MATPFTVTLTEPKPIITQSRRILNLPPEGTRMRAALGKTSIEFRVGRSSMVVDGVFCGQILGSGSLGMGEFWFWTSEVPWKFEILDDVDA